MAEAIMAEEGLPETTPLYRFQGMEHCVRSFELEIDRFETEGQGCGYVVFTHVDDRAFGECFEESREKLLMHACKTYNFTTHFVVLRMPSRMHERAHRAFSAIFDTWQRGQSNRLESMGGAEQFLGRNPEEEKDPEWPTIVVEVGWTEATPALMKDCLFWLRESGEEVRVALSFKVYVSGQITIQQWSLRHDPVRVESTQEITIVRKKSTEQHEISGSLTIPFEDVYLCPKSPGDINFELTHDDMRGIATSVWKSLDFHMKNRARRKK
ncbi:uncharacterized protein N7477_000999 [Penicillium maclennaniae]|uniref:uncharacterized protein n=1 Tax=Penicillium maclennaniae TaxID=1343394 RepID=UPI0025408743|nr:uncharacterized protein N7477_000999 [Penicillium maclennaniae]KAJ5684654.1 hypothetical protein N7477_000999 [Penicillium maclennaniae]